MSASSGGTYSVAPNRDSLVEKTVPEIPRNLILTAWVPILDTSERTHILLMSSLNTMTRVNVFSHNQTNFSISLQ
jgi:hypothetical protein